MRLCISGWRRWGGVFDIPGKRGQVAALQKKTESPDFWNDPKAAEVFMKNLNGVKSWVTGFDKAFTEVEDLDVLYDFAKESLGGSADETVATEETQELEEAYSKAVEDVEALELRNMLGAEGDNLGAVLTINSGAGGTEANDWSSMLMRMYMRWGERNGYKVTVNDLLEGDEAGIKSATIQVEGDYAYGYLKGEMGVHRLVRVSPFDSSGRRHTSFASLEVMPEIDDNIEVEINPDDLKVDTYRASGAGGQKVNKTSSAVRITHIPTGIVVSCQIERSQHQNREVAMRMLKSKLLEIKEREHLDKIEDIKGDQKEIGWGSQIRSYVFMPYTLAKDHRTGFENGNINAVMDGDIDGFINAYLKMESLKNQD